MDVAHALGRYLEVADAVAPGLIEGLYVVGSFALDDWHEDRSDIDIVAITAEPATEEDGSQIRLLHAILAEQQPRPFVDGPYLAWGDLVVPPSTGLYRPWSLDGVAHHDGECFEINPVTWYTLATYGVTVRGPLRERLGAVLDTEERIRFVADNLHSYWANVAAGITAVLTAEPDREITPSMLEWCALGALRLHYTAFTGDVTSKRGAGEHGLSVAPARFHDAIRAGLAIRAGEAAEASGALMLAAAALIEWCITEVDAGR